MTSLSIIMVGAGRGNGQRVKVLPPDVCAAWENEQAIPQMIHPSATVFSLRLVLSAVKAYFYRHFICIYHDQEYADISAIRIKNFILVRFI